MIQGTQTYSYYNNLPAQMMDRAIARSKHMHVAWMVYIAICAQVLGVTAGVYLLFGDPAHWWAALVSSICFIGIFVLLWLERSSQKALGLTKGFYGGRRSTAMTMDINLNAPNGNSSDQQVASESIVQDTRE